MIKVTLVFKNGNSYILDVDPLELDDFLDGIASGNKMSQSGYIGKYTVTTAFIDSSEVAFCLVNYPENYEEILNEMLGIEE